MWAPASDDWDADATFIPGSDEEGGGRWVQHRPVPSGLAAGARRGQVPRLADAVPPSRLLPRHGAAMGLDARAAAEGAEVLNLFGYTGVGSLLLSEAGAQDRPCRCVEEIGRGRARPMPLLSGMDRPADPLARRRCGQVHRARGAARPALRRHPARPAQVRPRPRGRGVAAGGASGAAARRLPAAARRGQPLPGADRLCGADVGAGDRRAGVASCSADLGGTVECGEMAVREEARGLLLPTAIFARWTLSPERPDRRAGDERRSGDNQQGDRRFQLERARPAIAGRGRAEDQQRHRERQQQQAGQRSGARQAGGQRRDGDGQRGQRRACRWPARSSARTSAGPSSASSSAAGNRGEQQQRREGQPVAERSWPRRPLPR